MAHCPSVKLVKDYNDTLDKVIICEAISDIKDESILPDAIKKVNEKINKGGESYNIDLFYKNTFVCLADKDGEKMRLAGAEWAKFCKKNKSKKFFLEASKEKSSLAFIEGFYSAFYDYSLKSDAKAQSLNIECANAELFIALEEVAKCWNAYYECRDLVNTPFNLLGVKEYESWAKATFKSHKNIKLTCLTKKEIEELKFEGTLTVNKGSFTDPGFIIAEYNGKNAVNKKPIVLVGKGVVYDTGGLSLKPTANSMDIMKCDMGGSASVLSALLAVSANELPINLVVITPLTDNRPGNEAICPGDVITYKNGKTVEILNTDAEGRLILADGLIHADTYEPELVISMATLTGAAARAIGKNASIGMGNCNQKTKDAIVKAGEKAHDRVVDFPFWDEYGDQLKSTIADIKNIGGAEAGMITAGKFLEHFTKSPYYHIDIAGPSFLDSAWKYWPQGATGAGAMVLYQYLKNLTK